MDLHSAPKSATSMWINTIGLLVSFSLLLFVNIFKTPFSPTTLTVLVLAAYALPIILLEWFYLKTYNNSSTGLNFSASPKNLNLKRVALKLLGLYSIFALIALIYWLFPEYDKTIYAYFFTILKSVTPILLILAIPYFLILDKFMLYPEDSYWQMGNLCIFRFDLVQPKIILQLCLGWLVKLFFLPMMYGYFFHKVLHFQAVEFTSMFTDFKLFFDSAFSLVIYFDLLIGTVGYILTLRIFDSHIRTADYTFLGWFVAIACYQPFSSLIWANYLAYKTEYTWTVWLSDFPLIYIIWGTLILVLKLIYVWATLSFGLRFSNLTHRGILTNGPYRFCKHPAYVCKNLSWWLIFVPFLPNLSPLESLKLCLLLLMVNFIYFMRARTEERHLSWDQDYVEYARYIENCGLLAFVGKKIPVLKFKQGRLFNTAH